MDIVGELLKERERREKFFRNFAKYAKVVKDMAVDKLGNAQVYVFGSAVSGDYHPVLSDIDIAIITDNLDKKKQIELKLEVMRKFNDVFELHIMDKNRWNFYRKFIDNFVRI